MRPRIAAIIPVWNEQGCIGPVVRAMPRDWVDRVYVVDGGSRDRTVAEAGEAGATVVRQSRRGYGAACHEGAAAAVADGAEIIVFLDGDGGDKPEMIPALVGPIVAGACDFVIGSRTRGARERGSMGWHQVWSGRVLGALIGLRFGTRYTDMCAFRAITAIALARLGMTEMTYGWNLEMQMRAARLRLRIAEVPVPHGRRIAGQSKVAGTVRGTLRAGFRILRTFGRLAVWA